MHWKLGKTSVTWANLQKIEHGWRRVQGMYLTHCSILNWANISVKMGRNVRFARNECRPDFLISRCFTTSPLPNESIVSKTPFFEKFKSLVEPPFKMSVCTFVSSNLLWTSPNLPRRTPRWQRCSRPQASSPRAHRSPETHHPACSAWHEGHKTSIGNESPRCQSGYINRWICFVHDNASRPNY